MIDVMNIVAALGLIHLAIGCYISEFISFTSDVFRYMKLLYLVIVYIQIF